MQFLSVTLGFQIPDCLERNILFYRSVQKRITEGELCALHRRAKGKHFSNKQVYYLIHLVQCLLVLCSVPKGIVHPKMKICWNFTYPQAVQDVDEFVSSTEQIWRSVASHHLLTNGSSAVNGCRQNERPNSWLHHNNPQVIHTTPVHQLMSCEAQRFFYCDVFNHQFGLSFWWHPFTV